MSKKVVLRESEMSVNKVIILGRLGQDPELKHTPNGASVCNFSVATSERWKDKNSGQDMEKTEWHRVVVWGKLAESCNQYLSKGREAFVEGRLETRTWEQDGVKRYTTEINATTVQFIGGQGDASQSNNPPGKQKAPAPVQQDYSVNTDANFASDDIPF